MSSAIAPPTMSTSTRTRSVRSSDVRSPTIWTYSWRPRNWTGSVRTRTGVLPLRTCTPPPPTVCVETSIEASRISRAPSARTASTDALTGSPGTRGPGPICWPCSSSTIVNRPDPGPPSTNPPDGRSVFGSGRWPVIAFAWATSSAVPLDDSDRSTARYSTAPSASRSPSVMPPLHSVSWYRTRRRSRASSGVTWSAAAVVVFGAGTPSGIGEPIADAADRLDVAARGTELVSQVVDVGIDGVGGHGDTERPRLVEQLVARQRLPDVPQQALEQRELARTQIDDGPIDGDAPSGLVEDDRPGGERWFGPPPRRRTAPGECSQPG